MPECSCSCVGLKIQLPPYFVRKVQTMADIAQEDLKQNVEGHDGLLWIRGGGMERGWNGIHYKQGLSGKNVGAQNLSINVATIPPGGIAHAHIHVGFEVMLYIVQGHVRHEYG